MPEAKKISKNICEEYVATFNIFLTKDDLMQQTSTLLRSILAYTAVVVRVKLILTSSELCVAEPQRRADEQPDAHGQLQDGRHGRHPDQQLGEQCHQCQDQGHHQSGEHPARGEDDGTQCRLL